MCKIAVLSRMLTASCLLAVASLGSLEAQGADLSSNRVHWRRLDPQGSALPIPAPASTGGYYGYYGYDVAGVPYNGLYSEPVTCLRSLPTPDGYRTYDVCR